MARNRLSASSDRRRDLAELPDDAGKDREERVDIVLGAARSETHPEAADARDDRCARGPGKRRQAAPSTASPPPRRNPRSSSAIIERGASSPSTLKQTRCGVRWVGWPCTIAPGTVPAMRSRSRAVSAHCAAAVSPIDASDARSAAAIAGDAGRVLHARTALPLPIVAARVRRDARRHGARRAPRRPGGPPNLCAEHESRSTPSASASTGSRPTVWQASVWNRTFASRASRAASPTCCIVPSSWFACCTLASNVPGARTSAGEPVEVHAPVLVDRDLDDLEPVALQHVADARRPRDARRRRSRCGCPARASRARAPHIASATDSVPPDVKTISSACAPSAPATTRRRVVEHATGRAARPMDMQRIAERVERGDQGRPRLAAASGVADAPSR